MVEGKREKRRKTRLEGAVSGGGSTPPPPLEPHYPVALKDVLGQGAGGGQREGASGCVWKERTLIASFPSCSLSYSYNPSLTEATHTHKRTCTWKRVADEWVVDELSLVQACHTVHVKAVETDDVAVWTLRHQHWAPTERTHTHTHRVGDKRTILTIEGQAPPGLRCHKSHLG